MKKAIIGSLVGAVIIFIWQFLSFGLINFHRPAQQYTEKQDAIMDFLNKQGLKEGGYIMPMPPETATTSEMQAAMEDTDGKPWAKIEYHNEAKNSTSDMTMAMIRGFVVDFIVVLLFCWLITKMAAPSFRTIFTSALATGLIAFLIQPYTGNIWYHFFDIWAYFFDAIVSWGLAGVWLGWWLTREKSQMNAVKISSLDKELA